MVPSPQYYFAEKHKLNLGSIAQIITGIAGRIFIDLTSSALDYPHYSNFAIIAAQVLEETSRSQNQDLS